MARDTTRCDDLECVPASLDIEESLDCLAGAVMLTLESMSEY